MAAPNRTWTGDITYIPTHEGWLFLIVVIDLFSRRVVGWSMQPQMHSSLVINALEMAWFGRSPDRTAEHIFIVTAAASMPAMSSAACLWSAASPLR